ncbi:Rossmann-like and DUF2520 domain-containing protein [Flavobacterium sp.]|uniref:Rossmann-like and DUF2520 domain-containing protein n=1 Tax=Flavobacterium sp. TaxID=239 RepID=UPI003D0B302B
MITAVVLGTGNVATHLLEVFSNNEHIRLLQVYTRNPNVTLAPSIKVPLVHQIDELLEADVYIISVTDNAILAVAEQIPFSNKLVVHTSGTVAMEVLPERFRKGVFYPLQTFSKNKAVNFKSIPICLEAENEKDFQLLEAVGNSISDKCYAISSSQRKALHVSAVFVCNFVNHLYQMGNEICQENNIPFEILHPLIQETADKIRTLSPLEAQTGPAKRQDTGTINAHLQFLTDATQKDIYKLLTKSIIDHV